MAEIRLTIADNKGAVTLREGDCISIRLAENATTGFQWDVLAFSDPILDFIGVERGAAPSGTPLGGSGGDTVFRFTAKAPGEGTIVLKLWRGFERDESVSEFSATLTIQT